MCEELNRKEFHEAIDTTLSGLHADPWLAQRVVNRERKEKAFMKPRPFVVIVLLAILLAIAVTAFALFYSFVQKAAEIQQSSGPLEQWSIEEKQSVIDAMIADGLTVDEAKYSALQNATANEQKQRIANEILLESKIAREALMDSYGFTDDSFKLFAKTISIKETGTWVITYMPIKYPEHIGKYVVELNAITGDIINCSWSYDLAPYKDLQPDTWESDIWTMEKTNRLLHFEATRMKILEEMEKEKGPFDEWTIQEKADFDADLLILGYPRNDCVVNILPQEDDINEQEALNKAEEIIRECLHEPSITIRPITVSFFLLEDNTKEWLIVTTTNEKPEETYTIEIASPSYEILSCTVPIENIEEPRNQNNPLYAYLEDEILNAAWNVMMTNYGFLDEVRPFFTATISNLDTMYEITFISNNYNPAKVGTYTIKLSKAGLATLSASWDLQHEYEQQGPQRPWKAAELWSSYEYNQYTTLQKKGKAIMSDAGSEVSWGMDFEHQAAYDTIYREAGYDRKQYYHALPSPIDLSKEGATTLAINAVTQKSPNLKNSLQSNDILYEFDVSEEDKPIWRISIPDLTNNSMFLVEIDSKNRNVIRITNSSLSN